MKKAKVERVAYSYTELGQMIGKERSWVYRQVSKGKIKPILGFGAAMVSAAEIKRITGVDPSQITHNK